VTAKPNFFVIGAARSGTTALAEMLRPHRDAFVTLPKEPHFLAFANHPPHFTGPGDDDTINRVAVTDPDAYLALYADAGNRSVRGDASVSTLYYADTAVANIERYFPDARLVVILREPAERAFSAYSYLRARGYEACDDFNDALALEPERRELGWHHIWHYVEMGRYAHQLRPFVDAFGAERVQVLFYEDLDRDPVTVGRRLFDFLRLDGEPAAAPSRVNVSGAPRSSLAQRAIWWGTRQPRLRATVKAVTPFSLRERVRRANLTQAAPPRDAVERLSEVFADEILELRSLLDVHYPGLTASAPVWVAQEQGVPVP
jgi:hypothetical protein